MGLIFIVWAIIPLLNNNIVLTKLIAKIWECGRIAKKDVTEEQDTEAVRLLYRFKRKAPKLAKPTSKTKANSRFPVVYR